MADVSIPRAAPATGPAERAKPEAPPRKRERGKPAPAAAPGAPPADEEPPPHAGELDVVV